MAPEKPQTTSVGNEAPMLPEIESHPFPPFIPKGAKVLIMGTFPPQPKRWCMDFYYPNPTNDFWKIMGLIFLDDRDALYDSRNRRYHLDKIIHLLNTHHIALNDTGRKARRLKGNASDKFLEIVEPIPLFDLLKEMPDCRTLCTTGEKAAAVIAEITGTEIPKMGHMVESTSGLKIWRMPSTSRAYPLPLEKKAEYYRMLFKSCDVL